MSKKIATKFVTAASVVTLLVMLAPALKLPSQAMTPPSPYSNPGIMILADRDHDHGDHGDHGHEGRGHDRG
ncbi:MAG TPA: hypothetical protein VGA35_06465 [bacterium]